jgi:uncharacterized Zn-finger protein
MEQKIEKVHTKDVRCFGDDEWGGHPTVFYTIGENKEVICGYCNKKFIYVGENA